MHVVEIDALLCEDDQLEEMHTLQDELLADKLNEEKPKQKTDEQASRKGQGQS